MSRKTEDLALRKELLRLRLEAHRLEIETGILVLRNPVRNVAIGTSLLKLLRSHPIITTGAGALLARVPRLALIARVVAGGVAAFQAVQWFRYWRRSQ